MTKALQPIVGLFLDAMDPLRDAVRSPAAMSQFFRELGWDVTLTQALHDNMPFVADLPTLLEQAKSLAETLERDRDESGTPQERGLEDQLETITEAIELLAQFGDFFRDLASFNPGSVGPPLTDTGFWTDLALDVPEYLLVDYLETRLPSLYHALRLLGVIEDEDMGSGLNRKIRRFRTNNLSALLSDPPAHLKSFYGWTGGSGGTVEAAKLIAEIHDLAVAVGLPADRPAIAESVAVSNNFCASGDAFLDNERMLDLTLLKVSATSSVDLPQGVDENTDPGIDTSADGELGILLMPVPQSPGGVDPAGLFLTNRTEGSIEATLDLSDEWALKVAGDIDASGAVGFHLTPASTSVVGSPPDAGVSVTFEGSAEQPWCVFGADGGPRLELGGMRFGLGLAVLDGAPEVTVSAGTMPGNANAGLTLVLEVAEDDKFLREVLKLDSITAEADLGIEWSSRTGLVIDGELGIEIEVPVDKPIGPIMINSVTLGAGASIGDGTGGAKIEASVSATASLGPFVLVVEGIGLRTVLQEDGPGLAFAKFGQFEIALDFKPPDSVGISLDAGAVTGGGYLSVDSESGYYAGVLDLDFPGFGMTAMGILTTKMPDGSEGWSLFISLNATFPSIPLGFGITLDGAGGLLGVNRTMEIAPLQDAVRSGSIDHVLFAEDPVAQAPQILESIENIFPIAPGNFVIGPMLRLGWGVPKVVTADLGVILSLPDPVRIAILGRLAIVLPDEDLAIVSLKIDMLGAIDFATGDISIDAELHDSRLVLYELFGSMALRACFGSQPNFLLSFGGFNDAYKPPPGVPTNLRRLTVALDLGDAFNASLEAYLAVTSNTVQFGASFEIKAQAVGLTARGHLYFDALFILDPFGFVIGIGFSVSISRGNTTLLAASIDLQVSGPEPWHFKGVATLTIAFVDVEFNINAKLGNKQDPVQRDAIPVESLLRSALLDTDAWTAGASAERGLILAEPDPAIAGLQVDPSAALVITQRIAPLNTEIDVFGANPVDGATEMVLSNPTVGADKQPLEMTMVEDWFAASQYFDMKDAEKLAAPAFEKMPAGASLSGGVAVGAERPMELETLEYLIDDVMEEERPPKERKLSEANQGISLDIRRRRRRGLRKFAPRAVADIGIAEPLFELLDALDGGAASGAFTEPVTKSRALAQRRRMLNAGSGKETLAVGRWGGTP